MPRTQKYLFKYKCSELACGLIIRSDKWNTHCKHEHGYKFVRGHEIKKTTIAVKEGDASWKPFKDFQVRFLTSH